MSLMPPLDMATTISSGFTCLAVTSLSGPAAAVTFSGLSTANLEFIVSAWLIPTTNGQDIGVWLNNDATTVYKEDGHYADGASIGAITGTAKTAMLVDMDFGQDNVRGGFYWVPLYKVKAAFSGLGFSFPGFYKTNIVGGAAGYLWANVAALISRIDVSANTGGNLATDTLIRLEGLVP